ncbi:MAG TPA: winged helix-turn-helix domain-containing protein [Pyrinomonadaceae bacterium]|jgi:DNA-binding winged helix-turn-helix (wHTH) protein/TolB-like protein/Tfp pilus assembly protein PilF
MLEEKQQIYAFDNFRLDVRNRELLRDGTPVTLPAKAFDMLVVLIENGGRLIEKEELFSRVWPDQIVEESNLTVQVSAIRKALGERKENPHYIATVPGHGYRFIGSLSHLDEEEETTVIERHTFSRLTVETEKEQVQIGQDSHTGGGFIDLPPGAVVRRDETGNLGRPRFVGWRSLLFAGLTMIVIVAGVLVVLKRVRPTVTSASNTQIKSIAVLPFKPLAADARDESLELGIADTLITRLSRLRQVDVRPTSAVRRYAGLEQDAMAAGREQRVDAVLDGSIQRAGERIRVTVRLVSVADGRQLWADKFDEKFTDIFGVQDSISRQVADAIVKVTGGEKEILAKGYTRNAEAYSLYVKGRYFWNKRTAETLNKSIDYFNQAIAKDPNYALAYAGLADAYVVLPGHTTARFTETHPKAKAYAQRALEIDSQLPEPYATLAAIAADYWDWAEADKQFQRALEMNPNYATAHQWYGEYLVHTGRLAEALQEFKRAQQLDPTSLIINALLGQTLYLARRYDEAIDQCRNTLEMDRDFVTAHWNLGMNYQQKGMHQEARAEFERAFNLSGGAPKLLALLGTAHEKSGDRKAALAVLEKLNELLKQKRARAEDMAIIYTGLGNKERAVEWLEKSYQDHSWLILYLKTDPFFDPLRSDPRFMDLVRRVGPPSGNKSPEQ